MHSPFTAECWVGPCSSYCSTCKHDPMGQLPKGLITVGDSRRFLLGPVPGVPRHRLIGFLITNFTSTILVIVQWNEIVLKC